MVRPGTGVARSTRPRSRQLNQIERAVVQKSQGGAPAPQESERLTVALAQAALGRRVFPADDWRPLVMWKDEATTSEARIREWWAAWPLADVAWAIPEGMLVVDVDDPVVFLGSGLPLTPAPGQETPRGFCVLYSHRPGRVVRRSVPGAFLRVGGESFVVVREAGAFTRLMSVVPFDVLGRLDDRPAIEQ